MMFQTSLAKGQRKNKCIAVSTSVHRGHWAAEIIPLLWSSAYTDRHIPLF
ncbi:unnamed protein product [Brassica rapa subsp. trilocularis]